MTTVPLSRNDINRLLEYYVLGDITTPTIRDWFESVTLLPSNSASRSVQTIVKLKPAEQNRLADNITEFRDKQIFLKIIPSTETNVDLIELFNYAYIHRLALKSVTPHIMQFIGYIQLDTQFISRVMLPLLSTNINEARSIMQNRLKKWSRGDIMKYKQIASELNINGAGLIIFNEAGKGDSLANILQNTPDLPGYDFLCILFEIYYTLDQMANVHFRHNDLHIGNVWINVDTQPTRRIYETKHGMYETYSRYNVKLYDFDRSTYHPNTRESGTEIYTSNQFTYENCKSLGTCDREDRRYDLLKVTVHIYSALKRMAKHKSNDPSRRTGLEKFSTRVATSVISASDWDVWMDSKGKYYPGWPGHYCEKKGNCGVVPSTGVRSFNQILSETELFKPLISSNDQTDTYTVYTSIDSMTTDELRRFNDLKVDYPAPEMTQTSLSEELSSQSYQSGATQTRVGTFKEFKDHPVFGSYVDRHRYLEAYTGEHIALVIFNTRMIDSNDIDIVSVARIIRADSDTFIELYEIDRVSDRGNDMIMGHIIDLATLVNTSAGNGTISGIWYGAVYDTNSDTFMDVDEGEDDASMIAILDDTRILVDMKFVPFGTSMASPSGILVPMNDSQIMLQYYHNISHKLDKISSESQLFNRFINTLHAEYTLNLLFTERPVTVRIDQPTLVQLSTLLTEPVEYGGSFSVDASYTFQFDQILHGENEDKMAVAIPQQHVLTWHTHPDICHRKGCLMGWGSAKDHRIIMERYTNGVSMRAHLLATAEGIYMIELTSPFKYLLNNINNEARQFMAELVEEFYIYMEQQRLMPLKPIVKAKIYKAKTRDQIQKLREYMVQVSEDKIKNKLTGYIMHANFYTLEELIQRDHASSLDTYIQEFTQLATTVMDMAGLDLSFPLYHIQYQTWEEIKILKSISFPLSTTYVR